MYDNDNDDRERETSNVQIYFCRKTIQFKYSVQTKYRGKRKERTDQIEGTDRHSEYKHQFTSIWFPRLENNNLPSFLFFTLYSIINQPFFYLIFIIPFFFFFFFSLSLFFAGLRRIFYFLPLRQSCSLLYFQLP